MFVTLVVTLEYKLLR